MASEKHTGTTDLERGSLFGLSEQRLTLLAATCFINVVLAVMGDLLFPGGTRILSAPGGGVDARFASLRAFTATSLADGQLPLWNPTVLSGLAHLGGFESGLYYPFNLVYRVFSVAPAVNFGIALHLLLIGLFTFLWLRRHFIHPLACIYGGVVTMLSGVFFLRAAEGELSVLEAFTWCPAAFIAIHSLSMGKLAEGVIGGTVVVAMQVLCGYPMAVAYTGLAGILYGLCLFAGEVKRGTMIRGAVVIVLVAPFLTAIQLWVGVDTFTQSARFGGDNVSHIASKAIASSDIKTAFAPWSDERSNSLGGTSLFVGVITMISAVYGLLWGTGRLRFAAAAISGVLFVLGCLPGLPMFSDLARNVTPLRYILAPNLLAIPAMLFVVALAGVGMDQLIRNSSAAIRMAGIAVAFTVALGAAAIFTRFAGGDLDGGMRGLLLAAGLCLCAGTLLSLVPVNPWFRFAVLVVGIAELYVFAVLHRPTMSFETSSEEPLLVQDKRALNLAWRNPVPGSAVEHASGNVALPSKRYSSLLARTQWVSLPDIWDGPFEFVGYHPLHRMLRVARVVPPDEAAPIMTIDDHMARFVLVRDYVVAEDREIAFAAIEQASFDPWRTVVLEQQPTPIPSGDAEEVAIGVTDESVNGLTVELKLTRPAILLMTDSYDRGWRARGLTGSSQWQYDVMPANVALRAVPLGAGVHRIRLEYAPLSFRIGQWVSVAMAALLAIVAGMAVRKRLRA